MIGYSPKVIIFENTKSVIENDLFEEIANFARKSRIALVPVESYSAFSELITEEVASADTYKKRAAIALRHFAVMSNSQRFLDVRHLKEITSKDLYRCRGYRVFSLRLASGICIGNCAYCYLQRRHSELLFPTVYIDTSTLRKELLEIEQLGYPALIDAGEEQDMLLTPLMNTMAHRLMDEFHQFKHLKLELRTKSGRLLPPPDSCPENVVIAWTLTTPTVWRNSESRFVASPSERINALSHAASLGYRVAVKFNPMVPHAGWVGEFEEIVEAMVRSIPVPSVDHWSMGILRLSPALNKIVEELRSRAIGVFSPKRMIKDGKYLTYPEELRLDMYRRIHQIVSAHKGWSSLPFYVSLEHRHGDLMHSLKKEMANLSLVD